MVRLHQLPQLTRKLFYRYSRSLLLQVFKEWLHNGPVAQLVERWTEDPGYVAGVRFPLGPLERICEVRSSRAVSPI